MLSEAIEDYLKAIYEIQSGNKPAKTSFLAQRLEVTAGSVSEMLKRLSCMEPRLVTYTRHRGVRLTAAGEAAALSVIRRHRLLETFLHEVLGFSWDEIHVEADRLEHYISERLADKIAAFLGNPATDPHGDPIPRSNGRLLVNRTEPLAGVPEGKTVRIARVHHSNPRLLRYLEEKGIKPGAIVTLVEKAPLDGPITVRVGDGAASPRHSVDLSVAAKIYVESLSERTR